MVKMNLNYLFRRIGINMKLRTALVASLSAALFAGTMAPVAASPSPMIVDSATKPTSTYEEQKIRHLHDPALTPVGTPPDVRRKVSEIDPPSSIVGGSPIDINQAPWQVALVRDSSSAFSGQFCGGSIVAPSWILTAAHCVEDLSAGDFWVLSGVDYLRNDTFSSDEVDNVIIHQDYNSETFVNDIALLHLAVPLDLAPGVREVISLPSTSPGVGTFLQVTGWGSTSSQGDDYPQQLQSTSQRIVSPTYCLGYQGFNTASQLCIGQYPFLDSAACFGDSGGPAAFVNGASATLIGITSYGSAAGCTEGYPDVFTRVYFFLPWIEQNMIDPEEGVLAYAWIDLEYATVYPKSDGFRDTIGITAHVVSSFGEGYFENLGPNSKLVIKKGSTVVKTWNLNETGESTFRWNGKKGSKIVTGTYKAYLVAYGLNGVAVRDDVAITVSGKKLVTKKWTVTKSGKMFKYYNSYDDTACQFYGTKMRVWTLAYPAECYGNVGLPDAVKKGYANPKLTVKLTVSKMDGDYCGSFIVDQATSDWRNICKKKTYTWSMGSLDTSDGVMTGRLWGSGDNYYTSYYVSKLQFIVTYKKLQ
jgi:hypothetical protein